MPASSAKSRTEQAAAAAVGGRPFPGGHEVRDGEMALAISGAGVDGSAVLGRNVFGVKREVFRVAKMGVPARRELRKRLRSELDAVRDLLRKAELYSCAPGPGAAGCKDVRRLFAPEPETAAAEVEEDDGCRAAKSRKASHFARESPKPDDRERLAGRLASMAAALPDHAVAFLQNRRRVGGDADADADSSPRGDDGGGEVVEMDMDVQSMKDGALFQLKMLLDKFAPESTPELLVVVDVDKLAPERTPRSHHGGRAPPPASGTSCCLSPPPAKAQQHQEAAGRLHPVQEGEEEEEEGTNICGGVSRIAIRDIAEEYGELVNDVGVQLLSPLQRKYVDLAIDDDEQDGYVDICGDASPVVFPAKTGDSSSSSSGSSSDATSSTDSDSSSSSPEAPAPAPPKENSAGEPVPALEAIQIAEPENQCAATVCTITKSPPAPMALPEKCGTLAQPPPPPEQAPEALQIAEPEAHKEKCVPVATVHHPITGGAPPPPAVLANENGTPSQPAPVPAPPVAAQIAEPQPQPQPQELETSDLIAMARQEGRRRARAKARQELLEMERAAPPDERIHPLDMQLLGLAAFEHVVSTARDARAPHSHSRPQVNDEVVLHFSPGRPSILQQLGVFLKPDAGADDDDEEEQPPPPLAVVVASDGEGTGMEMEEGQIL